VKTADRHDRESYDSTLTLRQENTRLFQQCEKRRLRAIGSVRNFV
jgi:hypothetical protein